MVFPRGWKRFVYTRLAVLAVVLVIVLVICAWVVGRSDAATTKRCTPTVTSSSISYSCWAAYPEGFWASGYANSPYMGSWTLTCGSQTLKGTKRLKGVYLMDVNRFTNTAATNLMLASDVCKIAVKAVRISGSGKIGMEVFVNQNHPAPAITN